MMSQYQNRARLYHQEIRQALLREWDPIGIGHIPEAQDEYDRYVSTLHKILITQTPRHEVIEYLWWLETEHMGLTGDRQATERFADKLLQIRDQFEDAAPSPSSPKVGNA